MSPEKLTKLIRSAMKDRGKCFFAYHPSGNDISLRLDGHIAYRGTNLGSKLSLHADYRFSRSRSTGLGQ